MLSEYVGVSGTEGSQCRRLLKDWFPQYPETDFSQTKHGIPGKHKLLRDDPLNKSVDLSLLLIMYQSSVAVSIAV